VRDHDEYIAALVHRPESDAAGLLVELGSAGEREGTRHRKSAGEYETAGQSIAAGVGEGGIADDAAAQQRQRVPVGACNQGRGVRGAGYREGARGLAGEVERPGVVEID